MSETTCLTLLPAEILHNILQWVDPRDLGRLPRVSRFMRDYIRSNRKLWKDAYLYNLDAPERDIDWEQELRDVVRLQLICAAPSPNRSDNERELLFVHNAVTRLLRHASPTGGPAAPRMPTHSASRNASLLARLFRDENARTAFFTRSFLYRRSRGPSILSFAECNTPVQQASAQLHCLWGRPLLNSGRTRRSRMHPFALSKVYDLREYTVRTRWGPFMDDGSDRVDWEKMEAIMLVLGSNINQVQASSPAFLSMWDSPFAGSWAGSWIPTPGRKLSGLDLQDPYGISGTWLRVVCFIDYNDFFAFNFLASQRVPDGYPCPALETGEATRLILMKLHVTSIEPPGEEDGQGLPVVHFRGISRSLHNSWDNNADSDLRGTCRLTREGDVRWTTFSIFDGEERWRSESVQVGGVKSARGVLGNWFDVYVCTNFLPNPSSVPYISMLSSHVDVTETMTSTAPRVPRRSGS
ncbi:hypothetical protein SODALDRAFT_329873 [Sodiomyces alkalinus F11]|uniref:F-box domain-containing protein n=1 Tax=Sodiomyces alkalinus (strain CBS 110278 / VKM F-3762 / F11) TaxID=1314773 RepID=A0A3N2Q0I0_SODAK|nr:hypothetical protein SODALDRAFT_329873 [Sodiomyces alkalinus F11]ROT40198.1 hypothetical protein SODALDRAFT_329873 [Sodiomyces alkalinus F11]